jgi:hypothetical protein
MILFFILSSLCYADFFFNAKAPPAITSNATTATIGAAFDLLPEALELASSLIAGSL